MLRLNNIASASNPRSGAALVLVLMAIILISLVAVVSLRGTSTFQVVTGKFKRKLNARQVAELGVDRAVKEVRRRFSMVANPTEEGLPDPTPINNSQYRPMLSKDLGDLALVLQMYAKDLQTIGSPSCAENVTLTNYGNQLDTGSEDVHLCLNDDPSGEYPYTVTLDNIAELADCETDYLSPNCGDDAHKTRLVSAACLTAYDYGGGTNPPSNWDFDDCNPPNSFHYGDIEDGPSTSLPAIGYRLVFTGTATEGDSAVSVTKTMLVFVDQAHDFSTATQSIDIDGAMFLQGGHINGTVTQIVPPEYLTGIWWGYSTLFGGSYELGRRYEINPIDEASGVNDDEETGTITNPPFPAIGYGRFDGIRIGGVFSNIGVWNVFQTEVNNAADGADYVIAGPVQEYADPSMMDPLTAALGASGGIAAVDAGGAFDEAALIQALTTYDDTISGTTTNGANSRAQPTGSGDILRTVDTSTNTVNSIGLIDNTAASLNTRDDDAIIMQGTIDLEGSVYVNGDLYLGGGEDNNNDVIFDLNGKAARIIASGNIYFGGNVLVANHPPCSKGNIDACYGSTDGAFDSGAGHQELSDACSSATCDNLELIAMGNAVVGDVTHGEFAGLAGMLAGSASMTYVGVPPLDGYRATDLDSDFSHMPVGDRTGIANWSDLMQVGFQSANLAGGPASSMSANPTGVEQTIVPGLLPYGADHIYGSDPANPNRYLFNYFRTPDTNTGASLSGWGLVIPAEDFVADHSTEVPPKAVGQDALGRVQPACSTSSVDFCDPAGTAALNGGYQFNGWNSGPTNGQGLTPQMSSVGFFNWFHAGDPTNPGGAAPDVSLTTYHSTGQIPVPRNCSFAASPNFPCVSGDNEVENMVSKTTRIEARVQAVSGALVGFAGRSDQAPRRWDGAATEPVLSPRLNGAGGFGYTDRDDAGCSGANSLWDCDQNGLTVLNGAFANSLMVISQGGIFIYRHDYANPVPIGARVSFVSGVTYK